MDTETLVAEFLLELGYTDVTGINPIDKMEHKKRFIVYDSMFTTGNFNVVTEHGFRYEMTCDWRSGPYFSLMNNQKHADFNLCDPDSLDKLKTILESDSEFH